MTDQLTLFGGQPEGCHCANCEFLRLINHYRREYDALEKEQQYIDGDIIDKEEEIRNLQEEIEDLEKELEVLEDEQRDVLYKLKDMGATP